MKNEILIEKWRPQQFEDVIGLPEHLPKQITQDMPHFLFHGNPGTGKTTTARIIVKHLDAENLTLNASDERGINTIRDKVKNFASTRSHNGKIKVILLDEMDYLTHEAMHSLRSIMETYSKTCRFLLTCNYVNRVVPAIRDRCVNIEFKPLNKEVITDRLKQICKSENIEYEQDALKKIVDLYKTSIRGCINKLDELRHRDIIKEDDVKLTEVHPGKILSLLKDGKFITARQEVLDNVTDHKLFMKDMWMVVSDTSKIEENKKRIIEDYIIDCIINNHNEQFEIIVEYTLKRTMEVMQSKVARFK